MVWWHDGSWMSRQRCAGRLGGKAEFPCGLTRGGHRRCAGRLGGKAEFPCGLTRGVAISAALDGWGKRGICGCGFPVLIRVL